MSLIPLRTTPMPPEKIPCASRTATASGSVLEVPKMITAERVNTDADQRSGGAHDASEGKSERHSLIALPSRVLKRTVRRPY